MMERIVRLFHLGRQNKSRVLLEVNMERVETQHIMETELKCVQRAATNACDRNCGECDLLMDTDKIIQAYSYVITLLNKEDDE